MTKKTKTAEPDTTKASRERIAEYHRRVEDFAANVPPGERSWLLRKALPRGAKVAERRKLGRQVGKLGPAAWVVLASVGFISRADAIREVVWLVGSVSAAGGDPKWAEIHAPVILYTLTGQYPNREPLRDLVPVMLAIGAAQVRRWAATLLMKGDARRRAAASGEPGPRVEDYTDALLLMREAAGTLEATTVH